MAVRMVRDAFLWSRPVAMQGMRLLWGPGSWRERVRDAGVHRPLLVAPVSLLQGLGLPLQLLDPSLGFGDQLHVGVRGVARRRPASSPGPTCFTDMVVSHPGPQHASVHIDVRGEEPVSAELQH